MAIARAPYMEWAKAGRAALWNLAGSNLLMCSLDDLPGAREALELSGSNDDGYAPLVEAIAERYGVAPVRVATAAGASGANFLACAGLVDVADDVLVERPAYDPLLAGPRMLGAFVTRFERRFEDAYAIDPDRVRAALTPRTRLIVVTNPHNPSGVLMPEAVLRELGRVAESVDARVLVDEVYLDATLERRAPPAATLGPTFISTSSLTKAYGLSGLRCGWALASIDVAEKIRRARDVVDGSGPFPAERLSLVAFQHLDQLAERARAILRPNFELVRQFMGGRDDLQWIRPAGGTVAFPRIRGARDVGPFVERLLTDYGTAVVPGAFFEAPAHFRLGFGGPAETIEPGLHAIARALDTLRA